MADENTVDPQIMQAMQAAADANDEQKANEILASYAQQSPPRQASVIQQPTAVPAPAPDLNGGQPTQAPNIAASLPDTMADRPMVAGGTPVGQNPVPRPQVGGLPGLLLNLFSDSHRAAGTPQGQLVPSKLNSFESFVGNFLTSLAAGYAQEGRGPGAATRGAAAAMKAPYEQAVQQYGLQQQARQIEAQTEATESESALRRAQAAQLGQLVTISDPVTGRVMQVPLVVAQRMAPGMFGAEARKYQTDISSQTKLSIAEMQKEIALGKIAHVYPVRDTNGNIAGMMGYNQQGQPVGVLPGAVPPASLFGNTKYTQNSDGSYSAVTTTPNIPGAAKSGNSRAQAAPASGSGQPAATNSGGLLPIERSTNPVDVAAVQVANGTRTLDEIEPKLREQVNAKANAYSIQKFGRPFDPRTGGAVDPFGVKIGTTATGQVLSRKEIDGAQKTFAKDYIEPLSVLAKTNSEFQRIDSNPNQTGAEKVTALLNAVGISFDPLKGKGARINQATIEEHTQARNIWQSAIQKLNRIFGSGGPITSQQISDYRAVAEGVVHDAYVTAAQEARRQGLAVDFLPKPTGQNQLADSLTLRIYADAAGGDLQKAHRALMAAGWR